MVNNTHIVLLNFLEYPMKKCFITLSLTLFIILGCEALSIKKAEKKVDNENIELTEDNYINYTDDIIMLKEKISELINKINEKDTIINAIENEKETLIMELLSKENEFLSLKEIINKKQKFKNIMMIALIVSILLNIILLYLLIHFKKRSKRKALPPAKVDIINEKEKEIKDDKKENNQDEKIEDNEKSQKPRKRGRPKKEK